jgi:hypothetical protein
MASKARPFSSSNHRSARSARRQNAAGAPNGPADAALADGTDERRAASGRPLPAGEPTGDAGPETGAWSLDADEREEYGEAVWGAAPAWEDGYGEGSWEGGPAGWDQSEAGTWDGNQPQAAPGTWYDEGTYPEEREMAYARSRQEALAAYESGYGTSVVDQVWDDDSGGDDSDEGPPRRGRGPWPELVMITALAVVVAAVILGMTSADRSNLANSKTGARGSTPSSAVTTAGTKKPVALTPPSTVPTSSTVPKTSTTVRARTTTAPARTAKVARPSPAAKNLTVAPGVKQSLIKSWLAANPGDAGIGPEDVAGTVPGEVYYGDQPASGTYWALVAFEPSAAALAEAHTSAGQEKLVQFQNTEYVFSWRSGPYWTWLGPVSTGSCPGLLVPTSVLTVWGLCGL